jgi:hypothetical protein
MFNKFRTTIVQKYIFVRSLYSFRPERRYLFTRVIVTASLCKLDHDGRWSTTFDENVRKLPRVSFREGHKSIPVKHKHMDECTNR